VTGAENDEAFNMAVGHVDQIRQKTGATIIALHHTPKDGRTTARGSGVLEGAIDAQVSVCPIQDSHEFTCQMDFSRDIATEDFGEKVFERVSIPFDDITDPDSGDPEKAPAIRLLDEAEGAARIVRGVKEAALAELQREPVSQKRLIQKLGIRAQVVIEAVNALVEDGRVVREGRGPQQRCRPTTAAEYAAHLERHAAATP
jgi:hypothetical protein